VPFKKKNIVPIDYTSRDFESIRNDLVEYTRRYYPETYKDFNEGSFGSLMLDTVAYVGDILSFYLDYQVNESFLETAIEYDNVVKLSRQLGYRYRGSPSSTGLVTFFIAVPADAAGIRPDEKYMPKLRRGTQVGSEAGAVYTLIEDVDFADPDNQIFVLNQSSTTGLPEKFAVSAVGNVISGEIKTDIHEIGSYQRFLRIDIDDDDVSEVVTVVDSEGHKYYEVEYLSQNIIYTPVVNKGTDKYQVPSIMKPLSVPRRYVFEQVKGRSYLQFGFGSEENLSTERIRDPSEVILEMHGRDYVTDKSFDPSRLIETDKLGVVPSNTAMYITYRKNSSATVNASTNTITKILFPQIVFENISGLDSVKANDVKRSIECMNENPIVGGIRTPDAEEIKYRAYSTFSSQNRAVTREDYISLVYNIPPRFGAVKRCNVVRDASSNKRNLNLFLLSENNNGNLIESTQTLKNNVKTWISRYKMINDTIDILDGRVINIGIEFEVISDIEANKYQILAAAKDALTTRMLRIKYDMGEAFRISDVWSILKDVDGVLDVKDVRVIQKTGSLYSTYFYDIQTNTTPDGRMIRVPENAIIELRYPNADIVGTVV
jgi:hypothetical protein